MKQSYEAMSKRLRRLASLGETFHPGQAKMAVVDKNGVKITGKQAWIWVTMEPHRGAS